MIVTKTEFAQRRGVSGAAVSQWIANGKITGDALVGHGRAAKINVPVAERQLANRMDMGQRLAQETLTGRSSVPASTAADDLEDIDEDHDHQARYRKARADSAEIQAERDRRQMLAEDGKYMLSAEARQAWGRELGALIGAIDHWLPDLAKTIAAEQPADSKALTVLINREWRTWRQKRTDLARSAAEELPETAIDPDDDDGDA